MMGSEPAGEYEECVRKTGSELPSTALPFAL